MGSLSCIQVWSMHWAEYYCLICVHKCNPLLLSNIDAADSISVVIYWVSLCQSWLNTGTYLFMKCEHTLSQYCDVTLGEWKRCADFLCVCSSVSMSAHIIAVSINTNRAVQGWNRSVLIHSCEFNSPSLDLSVWKHWITRLRNSRMFYLCFYTHFKMKWNK